MRYRKSFLVFCVLFHLVFPLVLTAKTNLNLSSQTNTNAGYLSDLYGNNSTNQPRRKPAKTSSFFSVLKVLFLTALVGILAYLVIRFMVTRSGLPTTENKNFVEIIANQAVGLGNYVEIVQIAGKYYLLSISSDGVRLLDKITDKEQIDTIELNKEAFKPKTTRFFDLIPNFPSHLKIDRISFLKNQKDRLKKL